MDRFGILFDIDHTLVIDNKLERVALLHVLELILENGGRAAGSLAVETAAVDAMLDVYRAGACSIEETVERFVAQRGAAPSAEYWECFYSWALEMVEDLVIAEPGAETTLAELQARGHVVGVLSNGWNPLQERKARRAGYAGLVMASDDMGLRKPDPRAFVAAASALGLEPARVWYVGDDPYNDIAGALGAGMRAVWIDSAGTAYPADAPEPTRRIGALADLLRVISDLAPA